MRKVERGAKNKLLACAYLRTLEGIAFLVSAYDVPKDAYASSVSPFRFEDNLCGTAHALKLKPDGFLFSNNSILRVAEKRYRNKVLLEF